MDKRLARHHETGQPFDWRDYIVIEDQFEPKQRTEIETSLDELSKVPRFQDKLIKSQSQEIMKIWEGIVEQASGSLPAESTNKYCNIENTKVHIVNAASNKVKTCFNAVTRTVGISFPHLQSHKFYVDKQEAGEGKEETSPYSLPHLLYHEVTHSADPNSYIKAHAVLVALHAIDRESITTSDPNYTRSTKESRRGGVLDLVRLMVEAIDEPYVIADTNQVMPHYFGEKRRIGHDATSVPLLNDKGEPFSTHNYMPTFSTDAGSLSEVTEEELGYRELSFDEVLRVVTPKKATPEVIPSASEMRQYKSSGIIKNTGLVAGKSCGIIPSAREAPQYESRGVIADCHDDKPSAKGFTTRVRRNGKWYEKSSGKLER